MKTRIALAAAVAAALLSSCASMPGVEPTQHIAGYEWEPNPDQPICEKVEWVQVKWEEIRESCGSEACAGLFLNGRMVYGCKVYSGYSEAWARGRVVNGESMYDHEARHILKRLRHPARSTPHLSDLERSAMTNMRRGP